MTPPTEPDADPSSTQSTPPSAAYTAEVNRFNAELRASGRMAPADEARTTTPGRLTVTFVARAPAPPSPAQPIESSTG